MSTSDPGQPSVILKVTGPVERFAEINPPRAVLRGEAGDPIETIVTITPGTQYPFKITDSRARDGKDLSYELTTEASGYRLKVVNRRTSEGRYNDVIILNTDSSVQPQIEVRVMGQIRKREIARLTPPRVVLNGPAGKPLKASVRVEPKPGQMFKITQVSTEGADNIRVSLEELREGDHTVYRIDIENRRKTKGRYRETVRLETTSELEPEISLTVTGNIL